MSLRSPIVSFLCGFVLLYIVLVLPWPGWERIYGSCFRAIGRAVFSAESGRRELSFETAEGTDHPLSTRVVIANKNMMNADGSGPVRNLDLDALTFAWKPTALFLALAIATPIPWRRRWRALLWGMPCVQAFILLFLAFCIWNESTEVLLVTLTPFWKHFAEETKELLVSQYTMVVPVMVWIAVTFRREDRFGAIGLSLLGPAEGNGTPAAVPRPQK